MRRKSPALLWIALALAIGGVVTWLATRRPTATERMQFAIPVSGEVSHMALSPDGSTLAFVSQDEKSGIPMLYLQRVGSSDLRVLPGTEGANYPFWSPDGAYVAFFGSSKLQKVAVAGGAPQALANVQGIGRSYPEFLVLRRPTGSSESPEHSRGITWNWCRPTVEIPSRFKQAQVIRLTA